MRIGILTLEIGHNYGGILQNWALQHVLRQNGHNPITIQWKPLRSLWGRYCFDGAKTIIKKCLFRQCSFPPSPNYYKNKRQSILRFIHDSIETTPKYYVGNLMTKVKKKRFDALIAGSDQVWRPEYFPEIEQAFFPIGKLPRQKKIAYAASFGTQEWTFNDVQTKNCAALIKDFDAVSVREESALELCKDYLHYDKAKWVLDPTLLVDKSEYEALCQSIPRHEKGFVFAYILDKTPALLELAKHKAKELGLELRVISGDESIKPTDTIENLLASFRDARYVITDSYHGSIFSLIFNKEFAVSFNIPRGGTRFNSLMSTFPQIRERMIEPDRLPSGTIQWNEINNRREELRQQSVSFLKNSLES